MPKDIQGHKFPAVGRCIYCGSDGGDDGLRSEHFLPEALGGRAQLLGSSCADCEKITSYLDGYLARRTYYDFRLANDVRGKKRKRVQVTHRAVQLSYREVEQETELPVESRPYFTVLPVLEPPGLLAGIDRTDPIRASQAHAYHYIPEDLRSRLNLTDEEPLSFRQAGDINVAAFARGIAKIGYGAAISHLGYGAFDPLEIQAVILGRSFAIAAYVGGRGLEESPPDPPGRRHWINIEEQVVDGATLIVAAIRIFADSGTEAVGMPIYDVVVGQRV